MSSTSSSLPMFHGLKRSDTLKLKKSNATGCSINVSLKARKAALIRKPASMEVDIDSASEIHTASESLCEATSTNSKLPRLPEIFRTHSSSSSSTVVASTPYALVSSSSSSVPRMSLTSTKPVTTTTANNIINNGNDEEEPIVTDELQDFISQFSTTSRQRRASTTIVNNVVNRQQLRRCSSIHVALSSPAKMTLAIRALNQLALCGIDYRESLLNGDGEECGALRKSVDPSPEDESEHREAARYRWKLAINMVIKSNRLLGITASKKQPAKAGTSITSTGGDAGLDDDIKILNASHFSENSASYILKSIYTKSDISTNIKVQMLVKATPEARPLEAIKALERFLTPRVRVFNSKYSLAQRISICQQMTYEYHPCGKFIIKEGHKALNFYIILSGRVDILKQRGDVWIRLNVLGKGDSFGDIGVEGILAKARTATVRCSTDCEFLLVNVADYREILLGQNSKLDVSRRLEMVKEFPLFKNLNDSIIHQLVQRSKTRYFNRGDTILLEGKFNGDLYFIVRGSVALRKWFDIENLLPGNAASRRRDTLFSLAGSSIKSKNDNTPSSNQTINSVHTVFSVGIASADSTAATTAAFPRFSSVGNSNHRQSLASSTSTPSAALPRFASSGSSHQQPMDFSTIKKNNEKVLDDDAASLASLDGVVIELASLVEGGIFPELVLPQDLAPKSMAYCIRNDPLSARAAKGDVNGVLSGELRRHFIESGDEYASYQTVVCEQAVTCIVISRSEFLRIAPPGLVRELFDKNTDVCCADSDDVRLQYQMMREWNQYKRQVISDAHQDKKFESQRSLKHC